MDWPVGAPTPAQMKELFAQIGSGRITGARLEALLKEQASSSVELIPFLREGEEYIGEELLRRAVELDVETGEQEARYLLDHQDEIPVEARDFYLVVPGWVRQRADGRRYVACLYWSGEGWALGWGWLGSRFGTGERLLRFRK